jgi:hypothetical protein
MLGGGCLSSGLHAIGEIFPRRIIGQRSTASATLERRAGMVEVESASLEWFQIITPAIALAGLLKSHKVRAILKSVFTHPRQTSVIEKEPDGSYVVHEEGEAVKGDRAA